LIGIAGLLVCFYYNQIFYNQILWSSVDNPPLECGSNRYIVFAPGFNHDGRCDVSSPTEVDKPVINPGIANEKLAAYLFKNRKCFSVILTQRAISDVWLKNSKMTYPETGNLTEASYGLLKDSETKVYQMHKDDPDIPVRTFEALQCALNRLRNHQDKQIVLVAHEAHYWRAYFDLSSMHSATKIVNPNIRETPYPESMGPLIWSIRDFFARLRDVRKSRGDSMSCRPDIALPLISKD